MDHRQLHSSKSEIENSCNASYSFSIAQNLNIRLTNRQMECIHLLMKGMTAKDIANELHLSFRTVESYLANIKNRLKCKNKTELIIKLARIFDV
jgi:DNA-binding NarL/FixJ family response regulator